MYPIGFERCSPKRAVYEYMKAYRLSDSGRKIKTRAQARWWHNKKEAERVVNQMIAEAERNSIYEVRNRS